MKLKDVLKTLSLGVASASEKIFPLLYYIIITCTVFGIAASFFSVSYLKSPGPLSKEETLIIPSGSSTVSIAKHLAEKQIIQFPQLFAAIVKLTQAGKTLKAGEYSFPAETSPIEVLKKIQTGDVVIRKITIAEGLSTFHILELIKSEPALKGPTPENIAEGDLLPETYEYRYDDKRADIVKRMQEAMHHTIDELWEKRQEGLPLKNKLEALALASIIEKETALADERKRVAAVFINRLRKNMRLQTDPTVIYAITNGKYILERPLSNKDLEIDSGYNTYRNTGLPPTPIANPGRASIEAALNPLSSDELYFVSNGTGGHSFSSNLKQHNDNVLKLRKMEKEAKQ